MFVFDMWFVEGGGQKRWAKISDRDPVLGDPS